jgi:hypothetical protein
LEESDVGKGICKNAALPGDTIDINTGLTPQGQEREREREREREAGSIKIKCNWGKAEISTFQIIVPVMTKYRRATVTVKMTT